MSRLPRVVAKGVPTAEWLPNPVQWWAHLVGALRVDPHEHYADYPQKDRGSAIAKPIADALEGAHDQCIIHRDLKPAHITDRPDGTVNVLDFRHDRLRDRQEPDWAALPSSTSLSAQSRSWRCLDKDPRRRLRDTGEVRLALETAK